MKSLPYTRCMPVQHCLTIFLAIIAMGCTTPSMMDLVIDSVDVNEDNYVVVEVKNVGQENVPSFIGDLELYVDGRKEAAVNLGDLPSPGYLIPGGWSKWVSPVRLDGEFRNVLAIVDSKNEITEFNEQQNTRSRSVKLNPADTFDLIIDSIDPYVEDKQVVVKVRNNSVVLLQESQVRFHLWINDNLVSQPVHPVNLDKFQTASITLGTTGKSMTGSIQPGDRIRVRITFIDPAQQAADADIVNNYHEEVFFPETEAWFVPYEELLVLDKISNSILWQQKDLAGGLYLKPYNDWYQSMRDDIKEAVLQLERGRWIGLKQPPKLGIGGRINKTQAWQIYTSYVAFSLWTEVRNQFEWSLKDYDSKTLRMLLSMESLFGYMPIPEDDPLYEYFGPDHYKPSPSTSGNTMAWNPLVSFRFMNKLNMITPDNPQSIVYRLTEWMQATLRHVTGNDPPPNIRYGYYHNTAPPVDRLLYPPVGQDHISGGCWNATAFYKAMLRAVNIPVRLDSIGLVSISDGIYESTHSRTTFPTLDMGLPHGDNAYITYFIASGNVIPIAKLFYPLNQMESIFIDPEEVYCNENKECHTPAQQAGYNLFRHQLLTSAYGLGDYWLYLYVTYGAGQLDKQLAAPFHPSGESPFLLPGLTAEERAEVLELVKARIDIIGSGNFQKAKTIITERYENFIAYK